MTSLVVCARRALPFSLWVGLGLFLIAMQVGCNHAVSEPAVPSMELSSSSFAGEMIPNRYSSCAGQDDISPELLWNAVPERTQSFTLIVTDKDSAFGFGFVHWVLYNIPSDKRELVEGTAKQEQLPDGSRQGHNDYDKFGYVGPCPPGHSPHHYVFDLYALDTKLNLPSGASKKQAMKAMKGHILASGELVGQFKH